MTVTISQVNKFAGDACPIINLGEVQLFSKGVQIPSGQLTFTLSTAHSVYPASNCNDGSPSTFCHSGDPDSKPTLTITSPTVPDKVVVYNRQDCRQDRIVGATLSVTQWGSVLLAGTFIDALTQYSFTSPGKQLRALTFCVSCIGTDEKLCPFHAT